MIPVLPPRVGSDHCRCFLQEHYILAAWSNIKVINRANTLNGCIQYKGYYYPVTLPEPVLKTKHLQEPKYSWIWFISGLPYHIVTTSVVNHSALLEIKKWKETLQKNREDKELWGVNGSPGGEWPRQKEQKAKAASRSPGKYARNISKFKPNKILHKREMGKCLKTDSCYFVTLGVNLGIIFCTEVIPLNFCCILSKSRDDDQQAVDLPNKMSEDLFAGLSTAVGHKRAVSLCDQGHALHVSAKVGNPPTLSLPSSPTPRTRRGGDNHELTQLRLTASMELSGVLLEQRNPLFWTYHTKTEAGITSSRTREHQTMLVGSVKTKTKK